MATHFGDVVRVVVVRRLESILALSKKVEDAKAAVREAAFVLHQHPRRTDPTLRKAHIRELDTAYRALEFANDELKRGLQRAEDRGDFGACAGDAFILFNNIDDAEKCVAAATTPSIPRHAFTLPLPISLEARVSSPARRSSRSPLRDSSSGPSRGSKPPGWDPQKFVPYEESQESVVATLSFARTHHPRDINWVQFGATTAEKALAWRSAVHRGARLLIPSLLLVVFAKQLQVYVQSNAGARAAAHVVGQRTRSCVPSLPSQVVLSSYDSAAAVAASKALGVVPGVMYGVFLTTIPRMLMTIGVHDHHSEKSLDTASFLITFQTLDQLLLPLGFLVVTGGFNDEWYDFANKATLMSLLIGLCVMQFLMQAVKLLWTLKQQYAVLVYSAKCCASMPRAYIRLQRSRWCLAKIVSKIPIMGSVPLTQEGLNSLFVIEEPLYLGIRSADLHVPLLVAITFGNALPLLYPIAALSFAIAELNDRFNFLRRLKPLPVSQHGFLTRVTTSVVMPIAILFRAALILPMTHAGMFDDSLYTRPCFYALIRAVSLFAIYFYLTCEIGGRLTVSACNRLLAQLQASPLTPGIIEALSTVLEATRDVTGREVEEVDKVALVAASTAWDGLGKELSSRATRILGLVPGDRAVEGGRGAGSATGADNAPLLEDGGKSTYPTLRDIERHSTGDAPGVPKGVVDLGTFASTQKWYLPPLPRSHVDQLSMVEEPRTPRISVQTVSRSREQVSGILREASRLKITITELEQFSA